MREIGINVLFHSLRAPEKIEQVYSQEHLPGVTKYSTLAGYAPDNLLGLTPPQVEARPVDVGFRSRTVPYWLGMLGQEKTQIVHNFHQHVGGCRLKHNVSCREKDRIYGSRWPVFIKSCKTMLGTESGSSITDFGDTAQRLTRDYLKPRPKASFAEVHEAVLQPYEGNVMANCISPGRSKAPPSHTGMVLFPGDYSGVLKPWIHYIPLQKDFGNFPEVIQKVKDNAFLKELTDRIYEDLGPSGRYSYRTFVQEFDDMLDRHAYPCTEPRRRVI